MTVTCDSIVPFLLLHFLICLNEQTYTNNRTFPKPPGPPTGAPVFRVEPQDVTVRSGEDVALQCQASGEPVPTVEWLRAGEPLRASRRLQTLPDGSLWLQQVEAGDAGTYECVAQNLLGSATARAVLAVRGMGRPRSDHGGQRRDLLLSGGFVCCLWGMWPPTLPAP